LTLFFTIVLVAALVALRAETKIPRFARDDKYFPDDYYFRDDYYSFVKSPLRYPQGAVVNSPPTVDLRSGARQLFPEKSVSWVSSSGRTGEWASR